MTIGIVHGPWAGELLLGEELGSAPPVTAQPGGQGSALTLDAAPPRPALPGPLPGRREATSAGGFGSAEAELRLRLDSRLLAGDAGPALPPGSALDEELARKVFGWTRVSPGHWRNAHGAALEAAAPFSSEPVLAQRVPGEFDSLGAQAQNKHIVFAQELAAARAQGIDVNDPIELARIGVRAMERWTDQWVAIRIFGWDGYPGAPGVRPAGTADYVTPPRWSSDPLAAKRLVAAVRALPAAHLFRERFFDRLGERSDPWSICQAALSALNPSGSTLWPPAPLG